MSAMSQPSTSPTGRSRKKTGEPTETAPMRLDFSRKARPATCAPRTGGSSRPTKSRWLLPAFSAGNIPIYDPESTVSIPERLPAKSRGFTTQNTVPSVSSGSACRVVATVTTTCVWSGESSRLFTVPKTISLYLSCDWPACSPSPLSNEILIVGPSFDSVSQASQAPIATATSGTIQMIENRRERLVVACSIVRCSARLVMASLPIVCLPQQGAGNLKPSSKYWLKLGQQMVSEVHLPVST